MTVLIIEGFECHGNGSTSDANLKARMDDTYDMGNGTAIGLPGDMSLVDNDLADGTFALEIDDTGASSARGERCDFQWPSAYNNLTNGSVDEFACGFRYYHGELDAVSSVPARIIAWITEGTYDGSQPTNPVVSSLKCKLQVDNDNSTLRFTDGSSNEYSSASVFTPGNWYYIEMEWKPTTSALGGYIKVYVDGVEKINQSTNVGTATFFRTQGFSIGAQMSGGNNDGVSSTPGKYDDIYGIVLDGVEHTQRLGDCRVAPMTPNADATPNDWTPSTGGDNYALVDDQDWVEADYVDATATGNDDHYTHTSPVDAETVHGVQLNCVCNGIDGTPTLHLGMDDGTADEVDLGVVPVATTVMYRATFDKDPSGADWTQSSVTSVEMTTRMTE
jgi:hypothetical protein